MAPRAAAGLDCNRNGVEDAEDLKAGTSRDCNANLVPDECDLSIEKFQFEGPVSVKESILLPWHGRYVADVDGDGADDIVLATTGDTRPVTIIRGGANDFFAPPQDVTPDAYQVGTALGDLDQDGDIDLAVADFLDTEVERVTAFLQGPDLTFVPSGRVRILGSIWQLESADLDADGDLDLVAEGTVWHPGNVESTIWLLENLDAGRFALPQATSLEAVGGSGELLRAGDVDADGIQDLLAFSSSEAKFIFIGSLGGGAFETPVLADMERFEFDTWDADLIVTDLDGDRRADAVLAARERSDVAVFWSQPGSPPDFQLDLLTTGDAPQFLVARDVNGDGQTDLVEGGLREAFCESKTPEVMIIRNGGARKLSLAQRFDFPDLTSREDEGGWINRTVGDFDGDRLLDLVQAGSLFDHWNEAEQEGVYTSFTSVCRGSIRTTSFDCNRTGVPDECELRGQDCNRNGVPDACDAAQPGADCNHDGVPDACEPDCDRSGTPDDCDLAAARAADCNRDGIPDSCETAALDRDSNGTPDDCDLALGRVPDCNANGTPDALDIAGTVVLSLPEDLRPGGIEDWNRAPVMAATGDFDGDGDDDVLEVRANLSLSHRDLGRPFEATLTWSSAVGGALVYGGELGALESPAAMATADFDLDGDLDVAILEGGDCAVGRASSLLLLANQGGSFERSAHAGPAVAREAHLADLDGDGSQDIVVLGNDCCDASATVTAIRNTGQGRFALEELLHFERARSSLGLEAGDFDGDQKADLILWDEVVHPFLQTEAGFAAATSFAAAGPLLDLEAGDLEGDASMDLMAAVDLPRRFNVQLVVLQNRGDATFRMWAGPELAMRARDLRVHIVDMNGDGFLDAVAAGANENGCRSFDGDERKPDGGRLEIGWNDGGAGFSQTSTFAMGTSSLSLLATPDLSGDGAPDMLVRATDCWDEEYFEYLLIGNDGRGRLELPIVVSSDLRFESYGNPPIVAGDFDGDGDADLLNGGENELEVFRNTGGGNLERDPNSRWQVPDQEASLDTFIAADLDRDGDSDLVIGSPNGVQVLLASDGRSPFEVGPRVDLARDFISPLPVGFAAGDFDGDEWIDVAVLRDSVVVVLRNRGNALLETVQSVPDEQEFLDIVAADLDQDGDLDMGTASHARGNTGPDHVTVLLYTGGGQLAGFRRQKPIEIVQGAMAISAGDIEGDGDIDLVAAHYWRKGFTLLRNAGAAGFADPETVELGSNLGAGLLLADLDGDGACEVVTANGQLGVFQVEKSGGARELYRFPSEFASSKPVAVDLDGDARLDVCCRADWFLGTTVTTSGVMIIHNQSLRPSRDADRDGVPDECQVKAPAFRRGDADGSGRADLTDAIVLLRFLFLGAPKPCEDASDSDDDGSLSLTDAVVLLRWLFQGGSPLPAPGTEVCGDDPTPDGLEECAGACQ